MCKKILLILVLLPFLCPLATGQIGLKKLYFKDGESFPVDLFISLPDQQRGLSHRKEYPTNRGAFFYYPQDGVRQFWMPDTYIDLDIFFLDQDLKVIYFSQLKQHPGKDEPPRIPRTPTVISRHVLEVLANSSLSHKLQTEGQLFISPPQSKEILDGKKTHQSP